MKPTEMSFTELVEFSGYTLRRPTEDEIDRVLSHAVISAMNNEQNNKQTTAFSKLHEDVTNMAEKIKPALEATSFVMDFELVGAKIFIHHQLLLGLEDHEEIRDFMSSITPTDEQSQSEFEKHFAKATVPHNHLWFAWHYLLIKDGTISRLKSGHSEICLENAGKKEHSK